MLLVQTPLDVVFVSVVNFPTQTENAPFIAATFGVGFIVKVTAVLEVLEHVPFVDSAK